MTPSEMYKYAWVNMTREKALGVPSYTDFLCQQLGSEGCEFCLSVSAIKRDYGEESTLFAYEIYTSPINFSRDYFLPPGGVSDITNALERSAKRFGVKMYANEKVKAIDKKGNLFAVQTVNFTLSTKKIIVAVPSFPFQEISGDVATDIKSNYLFKAILPRPCFKAAAIYSYPWWENNTSAHNITLKPFERFFTGATCLGAIMPYR